MSSGEWRYSLGDDGRERGVYVKGNGKNARWEYASPLPYVTARLSDRDGDGRRDGVRYRLTMDMDATSKQAAICDTKDVSQGDWAPRLDVPLSADRKIRDAVASAIYEIAHHPGVLQGEAVPTWTDGELIMPPADLCPDGYMDYAADEDRALEAWRELGQIIAESPRLGLFAGAALAGLYVAPLERQPFILEAAGGARSGKSSAVVLGGAVLGYAGTPKRPRGTVRSSNSSAQGMQQALRGLSVLPALADETGAAKRTPAQKEEFIFTISQGASRTVGTRSGTGYRTAGWSGIYLATGNESLGEGIRNEGVWARVVSTPTPVTATPAAARRVAQLVPVAYGWPLQWLLRRGMDVDGMAARVVEAEQDLPLADGGVAETLGEHLSLIVAGARLLGDLVDVAFGDAVLVEARSLVDRLVTRLDERGATPGDRLMSAVVSALASHPRTFPDLATYRAHVTGKPLEGESFPPQLPPVVDGFIPRPGQVAVLDKRMNAVAMESEIPDAGPGLDELYEAGHLVANKGRRQKSYKVDGVPIRTYTFVIPNEDDEAPASEGQSQGTDGGPAGTVTPDEAGTSANTRTERDPDEGQRDLFDTTDEATDEGSRVATEARVTNGNPRVTTGVTNGTPPTGNPAGNPVTSENTPSEGAGLPKLPIAEDVAVYREPGNPEGDRVATGNPGPDEVATRGVGTPRPRPVATPPTPNEAGHVLAVTLTPDTLYLAGPGDSIRTEEPGPLVNHLGRLLDWVAGVLPPGGGTIAVDGDAADLLGWPYDMERPEDRTRPMVDRPRCVEEAAAHGWTTRTVGGWTTWERGERGTPAFASVTVACLPWMDRRALGTGANILLDADDDAGSAVYLLARVAALVGVPFAYTAGSTFAMAVRNRYYDRHGQTRRLKGKSRRPMMRLNSDPNRGPVCAAFHIPDGGMTWRRVGATDGGRHEERHVMGLDAIGQHLGTAIGGSFALDPLVERDAVEWDPRLPALWELAPGAYRLDETGPSLAGPTASTTIPWMAHTETVKLLVENGLHSDVFTTRAWVPMNRDGDITRGTQILRPLAERIRDAIQSIPRDTPDDLEKRVRAALKSMYTEAAGELTRHPFVRRPDWSMGIWSGARAQTLRRAVKIWRETGEWPIEIVHDCLYYETDGIGEEYIPAPSVLKYDKERVRLGHVKMDFPDPDKGEIGTMAEYVKKRGAEPTKTKSKARKSRKGDK
ncbi:DUF927 domain-containing protein [Nocardiopsis alba]|uniref:DUF927 domain-containing protein n=1 Tax=Nocardiopsis alba TaxID=53437 RepID=UPI0033CE9A06